MTMRTTIVIVALALLVAACAPAAPQGTIRPCTLACIKGTACVSDENGARCEPVMPDGATRCSGPRQQACTMDYNPVCGSDGKTYGNGCGACANADVAWHTPGECPDPALAGMIACDDPRPEACAKDYNPVCAFVDNGIRCFTTPCPSEDHKTYGNDCSACADAKVYGYTLGACDPEMDNNPADDDLCVFCKSASNDPRCAAIQCPVPGGANSGLAVRQMMICKTTDGDKTQLAESLGIACVDACPQGYDQYRAQIGPMCIPHYGKDEIKAWAACSSGADCDPELRCALATRTTDGHAMAWLSEYEGFRCVPDTYASMLLNTGGLTTIDENGEKATAIA